MNREQELRSQLDSAVTTGDIDQIARVSKMLNDIQKSKTIEADKAKQALLDALRSMTLKAITNSLASIIDAGKLDEAQGVYFTWTFGDEPEITFTKARQTPRVRIVKHPNVKTIDLVKEYGHLPFDNDTTDSKSKDSKALVTYADKYFTNSDSNFRYTKIRIPLLKLAGHMT